MGQGPAHTGSVERVRPTLGESNTLDERARESLVKLWAYAYTRGARHMLRVVSGHLHEWGTALATGQNFDLEARLTVEALLLEQEALQFGECMVAGFERSRRDEDPRTDS